MSLSDKNCKKKEINLMFYNCKKIDFSIVSKVFDKSIEYLLLTGLNDWYRKEKIGKGSKNNLQLCISVTVIFFVIS